MAQETRAQKYKRWKQTLNDMGAYEAHEKVAQPYANEKDKYQRMVDIGMDMNLYGQNGKSSFERGHPKWDKMPMRTTAEREERWQEMMKIMQKEAALSDAVEKANIAIQKTRMNRAYEQAHPEEARAARARKKQISNEMFRMPLADYQKLMRARKNEK